MQLKDAAPVPTTDPQRIVGQRIDQASQAIFITAVAVGAFVLFVVEPMVGKMLLPLAGGTAAIWTTSVLFFQATLTAGYLYVHGLSLRWTPRVQVVIHLILMASVLAVLPIALHLPGPASAGQTPIFWLLGVLILSAGLPFFVVSTTSPLLQRWISMTNLSLAADPYPLYQASNLASLVALLAYPAIIELRFGIIAQQQLWVFGYLALLLLAILCGLQLWIRSPKPVAVGPDRETETLKAAPRPTWLKRGRWILLAAVPSAWMLGVTSYFTTSIRPLPLLWVVPLAIYLLSFAVVFGRRPMPLAFLYRAFPFLAIPLLGFTVLGGRGPFWFLALFHLGTFLVGALICHGQLAAERPSTDHLTEFYLWLSIGGALGGVFAALVAPLVFNDYLEYPIAIVAACYLRPGLTTFRPGRAVVTDLAPAVALLAGLFVLAGLGSVSGMLGGLERVQLSSGATAADLARVLLVFAIPAIVVIGFSARQVRFGTGAAVIVLLSLLPIGSQGTVLYQARDFYGVHTVLSDPAGTRHLLMDGITIHGVQLNDPDHRDIPAAYYSPTGPAGDVFRMQSARFTGGRVGIVGLGSGALSCFATSSQHWTYFELDPIVERIARDPRLFTYLRDCPGGGTDVVIGDGRLSLAADEGSKFNVLVVDAFGSDAVPTHLLTREAIELYLSRLAPGGLLLFNISNKYLDLSSVLAAEASSLNLAALERVEPAVSATDAANGAFPSDWLVLAPSQDTIAGLPVSASWVHPKPNPGQRVWTDDYSNVLVVTRFN